MADLISPLIRVHPRLSVAKNFLASRPILG